jgi:hypothetical protein
MSLYGVAETAKLKRILQQLLEAY